MSQERSRLSARRVVRNFLIKWLFKPVCDSSSCHIPRDGSWNTAINQAQPKTGLLAKAVIPAKGYCNRPCPHTIYVLISSPSDFDALSSLRNPILERLDYNLTISRSKKLAQGHKASGWESQMHRSHSYW